MSVRKSCVDLWMPNCVTAFLSTCIFSIGFFSSVVILLFQQLHYTFNKVLLLQEPLLVVGAFYLLFMLVIIYMRLDFAISKVRQEPTVLRARSVIDNLRGREWLASFRINGAYS